MHLSRFSKILPAALVTSFILVGCGGGGGGGGGAVGGPTPQPTLPPVTTITIDGQAAKGIIVGGIVTVYPIVNGAVDLDNPLGTATTDANGAYSIDIDDVDTTPVVVRVTPASDGTTVMRCDLAAGCGSGDEVIAFGGDVPLTDAEFTLDAVLANVDGDIDVSVTVLTDAAAKVAVEAIGIASDTSPAAVETLINDANSSVANRFGITGDITEIPIVDITDPEAVAIADDDVIEYNLYSAAVVEATLGSETITSIEDAVSGFVTQYVDNGGISDTETESSDTVTLEDILDQASAVIEAIEAADASGDVDLGSLGTEIAASAENAENGSTEPSSGTPAEGNFSDLAAAKTTVSNIRNLSTGANLTAGDSFGEEIDLANETFDNESSAVFEAMVIASASISNAWEALQEDETLTSFEDENSGVTVSIASTNDVTTYSVDANITVEQEGSEGIASETSVAVGLVMLDANSGFTEEGDGPITEADGTVSDTTSTSASVDLNISGSAASDEVSLSITSGVLKFELEQNNNSTESVEQNPESGETLSTDTTSDSASITDLVFELDIALAEVGQGLTNPITFTGEIGFSLPTFSSTSQSESNNTTDSESGTFISFMNTSSDATAYGVISISASGEFSSAAGDSLSASLVATLETTDVGQDCESSSSFDPETGEFLSENSCTDSDTEFSQNIDFTLIFNLDVAGVSDDINVELSGENFGSENVTANLEIAYDSIMLDAEYEFEADGNTIETDDSIIQTGTTTITITSESGVVITLISTTSENAETGELVESNSGTLILNDTVYATISDELGFVVVSYNDGTNVSL